MKNTKTCPKCGGNNIVLIKNDGRPDATKGNNLMCGSTTLTNMILVERYICCDCGYTEEWVDKRDIETLLKSKKIKKI